MRLRHTTRRLMILVALTAIVSWITILCRPLFRRRERFLLDPFEATEMFGPNDPEPK